LAALENSQDISDPAEFKYLGNFTSQAAHTVAHFLELSTLSDFQVFIPILKIRGNFLFSYLDEQQAKATQTGVKNN
jgi:hypothetical protein